MLAAAPQSGEDGSARELLIAGWPGSTFMGELLREFDRGNQALPAGSGVTLLNDHDWDLLGEV